MKVCEIIFKDNGKVYNFDLNNLKLKKDDYVIVETEKGMQFGKVFGIQDKNVKNNLKPIIRVATKKDYDVYLKNLKISSEALHDAKKIAEKMKLQMQIIDAVFTFDKSQLFINFIADNRIDFRDLVKELAAKYKTRIELHQIGVRDKAKDVGGIGSCGRQLCCSKFLNHIDTISINMAKNQNIALNPNKINGVCGRLLCCLSYEDETYVELKQNLPKVGEKVYINKKPCKVISVDVLNQKYKIEDENEIKEIDLNDK